MSSNSTYATLNYDTKQGDSLSPQHNFQNSDATVMTILGRTFSMIVTQWATVITVAGTVATPANGIVIFSFTNTQMTTLTIGTATYEAKYTATGNVEQTYLVGTINIT